MTNNMNHEKDKITFYEKRTGTKKLKTQRLLLRKILPHDFFAVRKWYTDPELVRFSKSDIPLTVWKAFRFTAGRFRYYYNNSYYNWAIVYKGRMRGFIEIIELKDRANYFYVSYKLDMTLKNQGIMTEALRAVIAYLKTQGIYYLIGNCDAENIGSKRVMEKAGMESVGDPKTNKRFHYDNGREGNRLIFRLKLNNL